MSIIRQESLFRIQKLYEMKPTQRYDTNISAINSDEIYHEMKKSRLGILVELNNPAMTITIFRRYVERIPTNKNLIKRLNNDFLKIKLWIFCLRQDAF